MVVVICVVVVVVCVVVVVNVCRLVLSKYKFLAPEESLGLHFSYDVS